MTNKNKFRGLPNLIN